MKWSRLSVTNFADSKLLCVPRVYDRTRTWQKMYGIEFGCAIKCVTHLACNRMDKPTI